MASAGLVNIPLYNEDQGIWGLLKIQWKPISKTAVGFYFLNLENQR
jgi:hypothetical protein